TADSLPRCNPDSATVDCWLSADGDWQRDGHSSSGSESRCHNRFVPLQDSHSFILTTHPLREKDRIVSFLTRETGKKRGVARGAPAAGGPFSPARPSR